MDSSFAQKITMLQENIEKCIYGKPEVIRLAIGGLLARGHLLIEDVPGIGKTTMARALAKSIDCSFQRIQFTSDLLPSDILGVSIFDQRKQDFEFRPGPIFAHVILADEINRTTPKTQSCFLEAMSDLQVSVDSVTFDLPNPFLVLATQNPMEFHGTYPLPESQLDRFMLCLRIGYPPISEEKRMLKSHTSHSPIETLSPVLCVEEILKLQEEVERVRLDDSLLDYILSIVRATREFKGIELGVSPRGALHLQRASQALALIEGRDYCIPDDIKRMALPCFCHRIVISVKYEAQGKRGQMAERAMREILQATPVPL